MKKVMLLLVCGLLAVSVGSVYAKSEWAKYQFNPIPDNVVVPKVAVYYDDIEGEYFLNCCVCHGPDVKHAGPKLPFCPEKEK